MGSDDRRQQSASLSRSRKPQTITKDRVASRFCITFHNAPAIHIPQYMQNFNN